MGTEGAGSADTAVRDAIDAGLIPGPRLRISGNAIDTSGATRTRSALIPAQHILSNATYANNVGGAGRGHARAAQRGLGLHEDLRDGAGHYARRRSTHAVSVQRRQLKAAVEEAARLGGESRFTHGRAGYAVRRAGRRRFDRPRDPVERRDHAYHEGEEIFPPSPRSGNSNTSPSPRPTARSATNGRCSNTRSRNSSGSSRRAFPLRWDRMWDRFPRHTGARARP